MKTSNQFSVVPGVKRDSMIIYGTGLSSILWRQREDRVELSRQKREREKYGEGMKKHWEHKKWTEWKDHEIILWGSSLDKLRKINWTIISPSIFFTQPLSILRVEFCIDAILLILLSSTLFNCVQMSCLNTKIDYGSR